MSVKYLILRTSLPSAVAPDGTEASNMVGSHGPEHGRAGILPASTRTHSLSFHPPHEPRGYLELQVRDKTQAVNISPPLQNAGGIKYISAGSVAKRRHPGLSTPPSNRGAAQYTPRPITLRPTLPLQTPQSTAAHYISYYPHNSPGQPFPPYHTDQA